MNPELPEIPPFDEKRLVDLTEQRIRRRVFFRRICYAITFIVGFGFGFLAHCLVSRPAP